MLLFKTTKEIQLLLSSYQQQNKSIGFVPTMGALHKGHISLLERSIAENEISICSIFVNPTQFNENQDLEKYPRTPLLDLMALLNTDANILFLPTVNEIYPNTHDSPSFSLDNLASVMEGKHRPGHFEGVVQVVYRLLDIIKPDHLYMGQKDFQQFSIIAHMLTQTNFSTQLVVCPIIRESNGLAMSSRNVRLSVEEREKAALIFQTLSMVKNKQNNFSVHELKNKALEQLSIPEFKVEYFEIVDAQTLMPIEKLDDSNYVVACTAIWVGNIRLIDNIILQQNGSL